MSEESLNQFLDRVATDEAFRKQVEDDWDSVSVEYDLSQAELVALSTGDEDALRRLTGAEVAGFSMQVGYLKTLLVCVTVPLLKCSPVDPRLSGAAPERSTQSCPGV